VSDEIRSAAERLRQNQHNPGNVDISDRNLLALAYLAEHPADDAELIYDCYATDPANWQDPWLLSVGFRPYAGWQHFLFINAGPAAIKAMAAGPWRLATEDDDVDIPRPKTRGDVRRLALALGIELKEDGK
jgi:hypothetical protein